MGLPSGAAFLPPDAFSWNDKVCRRLSAAQYRLLQILTDGPNLRGFVPFTEIAAHVWADGPMPGNVEQAVRQLARRLEDKLHAAGVPLLLDRKGFAYRLLPFGKRYDVVP
jgi:hypothetical protein